MRLSHRPCHSQRAPSRAPAPVRHRVHGQVEPPKVSALPMLGEVERLLAAGTEIDLVLQTLLVGEHLPRRTIASNAVMISAKVPPESMQPVSAAAVRGFLSSVRRPGPGRSALTLSFEEIARDGEAAAPARLGGPGVPGHGGPTDFRKRGGHRDVPWTRAAARHAHRHSRHRDVRRRQRGPVAAGHDPARAARAAGDDPDAGPVDASPDAVVFLQPTVSGTRRSAAMSLRFLARSIALIAVVGRRCDVRRRDRPRAATAAAGRAASPADRRGGARRSRPRDSRSRDHARHARRHQSRQLPVVAQLHARPRQSGQPAEDEGRRTRRVVHDRVRRAVQRAGCLRGGGLRTRVSGRASRSSRRFIA